MWAAVGPPTVVVAPPAVPPRTAAMVPAVVVPVVPAAVAAVAPAVHAVAPKRTWLNRSFPGKAKNIGPDAESGPMWASSQL